MLELYLEDVQEKIGYRFKNITLLRQAFISPSVTEALYNRVQNYQVLEFIGDAVLSFAVVKNLSEKMCRVDGDGQFICSSNEGKLSSLKQNAVKNETLSHCLEMLGFNAYIERFYGHFSRDKANKRGDLAESVLGAVAVDSGWDVQIISKATEKILCWKDISVNYEENLRRLCFKKKYEPPIFEIRQTENGAFECTAKITNLPKQFKAKGDSELLSRISAAKLACNFFEKKILVPATGRLNNFCEKKKLPRAQYCFTLRDDGKEKQWTCEAKVNAETAFASARTKQEAKNLAAEELLGFLEYGRGLLARAELARQSEKC